MGSALSKEPSKATLAFKCPQCGAQMPLWPGLRQRFSRLGRQGKQQCRHCGTWVVSANGFALGFVLGLVLAAVLIAGEQTPLGRLEPGWLRFSVLVVLAAVVGLIAGLFLTLRFGRWQALPGGPEDSAEVKRWTRLMNLTSLVAIAAVWGVLAIIWLQVKRLSSGVTELETPAAVDSHIHSVFAVIGMSAVLGFGVAAAAAGVAIYAARQRQRARKQERPTTG